MTKLRFDDLILACFLACLMWLAEGYVFGVVNHGQEIPPILSILDARLYQNDFAVQDFILPGTRYFYYHIAASLADFGDLGVDRALLILKCVSQFFFYLAVVAISRQILRITSGSGEPGHRAHILLASILALAFTLPLLSWGSVIFQHKMVPSTLAMAIAIWALYFGLKGRWTAAFAISGGAIFIQFLVGLYAGLVLIPALLAHCAASRDVKQPAAALAMWLCPALIVFGMTLSSDQPTPQSFNFLEVFGQFRVPHHWLPSTGSAAKWLSDLLLLISAALAAITMWRAAPGLRRLIILLSGVLVVAVAGVAANVLFVEILPITLFGKLQFQRIMPFGHIAAFLMLATYFLTRYHLARSGPEPQTFITPAIIALLVVPTVFGAAVLNSRYDFGALIVAIASAPLICLFAAAGRQSRLAIALATVMVLIAVNTQGIARLVTPDSRLLETRFAPLDREEWRGVELVRWLREETPQDSLVIIPPDWSGVSDIFALQSRRATYFSFKNVPYSEHGVWQWSKRLESLIGVSITPELKPRSLKRRWRQRSFEQIEAVAMDAGACFLVDRMADRKNIGFEPLKTSALFGGEVWGLWRFEFCKDV